MGDIKKKLLQEIDARIARKKALREEVASRKDDVEVYILKLMEAIDESMSKTVNTSLNQVIVPWHVKSLENDIKSLDPGAKVEVTWYESLDPLDRKHINGVLIKWSLDYQKVHNCDPERYIDITSLLLK